MTFDEDYTEAEVYTTSKDKNGDPIYYVKVKFLDAGFYIGSITARTSPKHPERGLWVQPPDFRTHLNICCS